MTFWFIPSEMYKEGEPQEFVWDAVTGHYGRSWAYLEGRPERGDRLKCAGIAVRYPMGAVDVETMALTRGRLLGMLA